MTTPQNGPAESLPADIFPDDALDIRWVVPAQFHSLGVELPEQEREAHLAEVAAEIWCGGTEFQRSTVASWYSDIAATAGEEGAVYSGFLLAGTEDDRVTVATLVIQADQADTADADTVAAAIQDMLSLDPANEVFRVPAPVGPVVVAVAGSLAEVDDEFGNKAKLELAQASAYIPVPGADTLVTMTISTPMLIDFPEYVTMLAGLVETVVYDRPGTQPATALPGPDQAKITEAFG
ncbi:hypothetical protein [Kitasatospora griseola]|uniref:hypothetical protein n=1 Tax=Kitasatospora griseola TaxID=2064 RepID=UPI00166F975C|nr:hypothetical protein [Kitasatospora griseola]GGQ74958.1 hypothetical protein GCM10010195_33190 [Kitasatospora griseola]